MGKKKQLKEKKVSSFRTPQVTPAQLAVFIGLVIYTTISNSQIFEGMDAVLNMCITYGTYFLIMILKGKMGDKGLLKLFSTIVDIITGKEETDTKIKRLESVLVLTAKELGELYEGELDKLMVHIRGDSENL